MVMNNGQWLIDFTGDTGLWNKEIINTNHNPYPSMIVWKYRKLYELSTAGNVYGVIFAAKDLFELCVKIPVLMSIIIIKNHPELPQNDSYKELMSAIVKQPLNSGDWRALAQHIFNNNTTFSLPDQLALILRNTCRLTNLKIGEYPDAIVWRNKTIAHGMLRFEDDPAYQTEVKEILEHFVNYFSDNRKRGVEHLYPDYYFKIDGVPVVGGRISASINNKIELFIHDIQYQEEHYILDCADEILFFESYNKRNKKVRYCNYETGKALEYSDDMFDKLYSKYVTDTKSNYRNNNSILTYNLGTKEQDLIMEYMHHEDDFIRPDFLINMIEDITDTLDSGIIGLQMERGMGKTCLTSRMDTFYYGKPLIEFAEVRTFHLNNPLYISKVSFINAINENFKRKNNHIYDLRSNESKLPELDARKELSKQLGKFLKDYKGIFSCEKLILVLDGIDELDRDKQEIIEEIFCSNSTKLSSRCFILVTSRLTSEEDFDNNKKTFINTIFSRTDYSIIIDRNNESYRDLVWKYIHQNIPDLDIISANELLSFCEYRLLYLKGAAKIVNQINHCNLTESFLEEYLNYIFYLYKGCEKKVIKFLTAVTVFGSISIEKYVEYFCGDILSFQILGIINDLLPLLKENRSSRNSFELANELYYEPIIRNFYSESYKDNKHSIINILTTNDDTHNMQAAYVSLANDYPALTIISEEIKYFEAWELNHRKLVEDENYIVHNINKFTAYSNLLLCACDVMEPEKIMPYLEYYVQEIDATLYWAKKGWSPDRFVTNGNKLLGKYSTLRENNMNMPYPKAQKSKRLYCSDAVIKLMEIYFLLNKTENLSFIMQQVTSNIEFLDKVIRQKTFDIATFEANITPDNYIECVEQEYKLLAFRRVTEFTGAYEEYMENYIKNLYSYIESILTTGYIKQSVHFMRTFYPEIDSAVSLYLDYYLITKQLSKGIMECERIDTLINTGKKNVFNSSFWDEGVSGFVGIRELNKDSRLQSISDLVMKYENCFSTETHNS